MKRKFKISEEQYRNIMGENIALTADLSATNGNVVQAVNNTMKNATKNGLDLKNVTINIPANESILLSKKELIENREKFLKNNTTLYNFNNFIKHINK